MLCFQGGFGKFGGANEGGRWSQGLKTFKTRDIHTSIHAQTACFELVLASFELFWSFFRLSGVGAPHVVAVCRVLY